MSVSPQTSGGGASLNDYQRYNQIFADTQEKLIGKKYGYGKKGPDVFDCSGAVMYGLNEMTGGKFDETVMSADMLFNDPNFIIPASSDGGRGTLNFYDYTGNNYIDHVTTNQGGGYMVHPSQNRGTIYSREVSSFNEAIKSENQNAIVYTVQLNWSVILQ